MAPTSIRLIAAGTASLLLLWLAMLLLGTVGMDRVLLLELYAGGEPLLADAARLLTDLGGWLFLITATAVGATVLLFRQRYWSAAILFVGPLVGRLLVEAQKIQLNRLRPAENEHLIHVSSLSFPSGHSANSLIAYVTMVFLLVEQPTHRKKWLIAAGVLIVMIGFSRVILGVHWPSDVVGGWAFGASWTLLLVWISGNPPAWAARR
jgi:membrane-associated phospholipid phosphatase